MATEKAGPDLFEDQASLPGDLKQVVADYSQIIESGRVDAYQVCQEFLVEAQELGYTFEYGLDGVPYGLRAASDEDMAPTGPSLG